MYNKVKITLNRTLYRLLCNADVIFNLSVTPTLTISFPGNAKRSPWLQDG